jgi:hypothetical protein
VDAFLWDPKDPARQHVRLGKPGAVPLRAGDQIVLEAEVEPPGYLYLLWLDSEGHVTPLYPWRGRWDGRPRQEERRGRLRLPEDPTRAADVPPDGTGMETVLLLVRDTPLDMDLKGLLAGLPPQRRVMQRWPVVWFRNGEVVADERDRSAPDFFGAPQPGQDPVLALQGLLRERLGTHCDYSRAVCFAKRGQAAK